MSSILVFLIIGLVLAVLFLILFAVGHTFQNNGRPAGHVMQQIGMIGVFVCVVGVFIGVFTQML